MAEEGFGFLGSHRLEDFRARNADVLSGPTPDELMASRSTAGSGLGLGAPSAPVDEGLIPDNIERGFWDAAGTVRNVLKFPGDVAAFAFTGRTPQDRAIARAENAKQLAELDAIARAEIRAKNIESMARVLQLTGTIAGSVSSIRDPEKRAAVQAQARQQIVSQFGEHAELGGGVFDAMVERQSIARQQMDQMLPSLMESRTFRAQMLANNGDLSGLKPEQASAIFTEAAQANARKNLSKIRTHVREINNAYRRAHPAEFEGEEKSDKATSASEFYARMDAVRDEIQFLQDPTNEALLRDAVEFFPTGLDLRPDKAIEKGRGELKIATVGGRNVYVPASEAEGMEAPAQGVTVNVGGLKGAKEGTFQSVLETTGNPRLAAAAAEGNAYQDPILGEWVIGGDIDRRKAEGRKEFLSTISDLRASAQAVADAYPDTDALTELENRLQRGISSGDPVIEAYEQAKNSAAAALHKATQSGPATDKDIAIALRQFPSVRAIAKGGKVTKTANDLLSGLEKKVANAHVATFPVEDQPRVASALRKRAQVQSALQQAEAKLGPDATDEEIEAEARRALGVAH